MNEIIVIFSIGFLSVIGWSIIRYFFLVEREESFFTVGVSFGLGSGIVALQLYFFSRIGITWNTISLFSPWVVWLLFFTFFFRKQLVFSYPKFPSITFVQKLLLSGIALTFLYVIFEALLRPLSVWDGWATWMLEAKVFFLDEKISLSSMHYMSASYPVLYPLMGTFIYQVLGKVDDTAVLLLSVAFYGFLSITFFVVLKKQYGVTYALLWTLILMTTQNLIRHAGRMEAGIADLPQGYYMFVSVMLFLKYLQEKRKNILVLLMLFLGFSALIKNEGTPFLLMMLLLLSYTFYKEHMYRAFLYLLIPMMMFGEWWMFKKSYGLDAIYSLAHPFEFSLQKVLHTLTGVIREFVTIKSWNFLWALYFYSLLFINRIRKEMLYLHLIILFQLSVYILVYMTTYANNPESSFPRLLLHVLPIVVYIVAVELKERKSFLTRWL